MEQDFGIFYKIIRSLLRLITPQFTIKDQRSAEEQAETAIVYVSHHQNLFGPISVLVWYPTFLRTWIYSVFLEFDRCYDQYVDFTLTERLGWSKGLAKIVAWPLAMFAVTLTKSARGIPVYRKSRDVMQTMKKSVEALENNQSILLFPNVDYDDDSPEVKEIYEGFLYIEKYYYQKTGKHVQFVPMYSDKKAKEIRIGTPIQFTGEGLFKDKRKQIAKQIQEELNYLSNNLEKLSPSA